MSARFIMGENLVEIFDFWCGDWEGNDPYSTVFKVRARSNGEDDYGERGEEFSGAGSWECGIKEVRAFVGQLEEMDQLRGKYAELEDFSYGSSLRFELDRKGHIQVSGTLFGAHGDQSLNFAFLGDQTALGPFVDGLKEFLKR